MSVDAVAFGIEESTACGGAGDTAERGDCDASDDGAVSGGTASEESA